MTQLSLEYYEICKAAVDGCSEAGYFDGDVDQVFSHTSLAPIRRLHTVVQCMNDDFVKIRTIGHKYHFNFLEESGGDVQDTSEDVSAYKNSAIIPISSLETPTKLNSFSGAPLDRSSSCPNP